MQPHQKASTKDNNSGTTRVVFPEPLIFKKDKIYLSLIVIAFAVINFNGLKAQLTFDDHNAIENNKVTNNSTPWTDIFFHDFWGHRLTEIISNDSFRPLTVFTFKVQHLLLGYHSAFFLRVFNYLIAAVNIVLVYYTSRILSYLLLPERDIPLAVKEKIEDSHIKQLRTLLELIPLCTAALFAVHPVHVEAVTSIVGRSELLCAALGFGAFICLHLYLQGRSKANLVKALALLSLSVFGKESGVTFAAMFIVYLLILLYLKRASARSAARAIALMCVFVFVYVQFRKHFIGHVDLSESPLIRRTENPQYFIPPGLLNWWSMRWVVLMKNLELSFFPTKLNCEYSFNCIPHLESMKDARFFPFTCVTIFFASLGFVLLYRSIRHRSHVSFVFLLCLLWYGISLSPVTHLFVKVGTFVAERCLYIPSFSAVYLVVAGLLFWAGRRETPSRVSHVLAVLICVAIWWTWLTVWRNEDWYNDESLFRSNMKVCQTSGKAHYQVAQVLVLQRGTVDDEAHALLEKAVALDDDFVEPFFYLAYYDYKHHNYKAAHKKARRCFAHPITTQRCTELYRDICKILFPNRKNYETFVDLAEGCTLVREAANAYRMAGLAALQEADTATAADIFYKSIVMWKKSTDMDPWMEEREAPHGEGTYCNTMYWYAHTYASAALSGAQPINATRLENFIHELVHGCEQCRKRWSVGKVLSPKNPLMPAYEKCLMDYNTVTQESLTALLSIFTHPNTTAALKQAALEASVDVGIMQLCNMAEVLNKSSPQANALRRIFPETTELIEKHFITNKESLLKNVKGLIHMTKNGKPLDGQKKRRWSDMASCSTLLSVPLAPDFM